MGRTHRTARCVQAGTPVFVMGATPALVLDLRYFVGKDSRGSTVRRESVSNQGFRKRRELLAKGVDALGEFIKGFSHRIHSMISMNGPRARQALFPFWRVISNKDYSVFVKRRPQHRIDGSCRQGTEEGLEVVL